MSDQDQVFTIAEGSDVFGSDGEKLGKVDRVESTFIVVSKGWLFPSDHFIPVSAISSTTEDAVQLNVSKDEAMQQGWENEPVASDSGAYTDAPATAGMGTTPLGGTTGTSGSMDRDEQPFDHEQDSTRTHVNEDDNQRIDRSEEELTATKRGVERGGVTVNKNVVEEQREMDVPVTEERVNVSRRTVDRETTAGDDAFTEGTIDVPVYGEEVDVQKRNRVVEEIDIDKEAVAGTQRVSDTVRREEVDVDQTGLEETRRQDTSGRNKNKNKNNSR